MVAHQLRDVALRVGERPQDIQVGLERGGGEHAGADHVLLREHLTGKLGSDVGALAHDEQALGHLAHLRVVARPAIAVEDLPGVLRKRGRLHLKRGGDMRQVALHAGGAVLVLAHGSRDADGAAQLLGKGGHRVALAATGYVVAREDHAAALGERRVAHAGEQLSAALLAQGMQSAQVDGHVGLVEGGICRAQQPAPALLGEQVAAHAHKGLVACAPVQVEQVRRLVFAGPCLSLQHHGCAALKGLQH